MIRTHGGERIEDFETERERGEPRVKEAERYAENQEVVNRIVNRVS